MGYLSEIAPFTVNARLPVTAHRVKLEQGFSVNESNHVHWP